MIDKDKKERVKMWDGLMFCNQMLNRLCDDVEKIDFKKTQVMSDIRKIRRELMKVYKIVENMRTIW